ncbi:MAG: MMPL family transporter, partial [Myxococcota bacterium]
MKRVEYRLVHQLTRLTLNRPKSVLLALGAITAFLAAGLPNLRTEFGYRVLVGDDHPSIVALDELIHQYGGGFPLYIAWECGDGFPCDTVFDIESLEMAYSLTRTMSAFPGIVNVESPATTGLLTPAAGGFDIRRFVEDGKVVPDAEELALRALDDPLWAGTLISSDGTVGVIILQTSDSENETGVGVVDAVLRTIAPFETQGFEFHLVGDLVSTVIAGRDLATSTANLIPFTVLVIGLVLLALSRSVQSAAITLATMGVALIWTFGLLGWLDWPQDGILEVLAPLILIVGVCDAVHLMSRYAVEVTGRTEAIPRERRRAALMAASKEVGPPCLITTLTTCGAFLSFVTSALDTFIRFGVISAFGVAACLILTFTLLPPLVVLRPTEGAPAARASRSWQPTLSAMVRTAETRAAPILLVAMAGFVVCGIGWLATLRVDTNWIESFGQQSRVIQWIQFLEDRVRPTQSLEIDIKLPPTVALEDPATLRRIQA